MAEHSKRFDLIHLLASPVVVLIVVVCCLGPAVRELWQEVAHG